MSEEKLNEEVTEAAGSAAASEDEARSEKSTEEIDPKVVFAQRINEDNNRLKQVTATIQKLTNDLHAMNEEKIRLEGSVRAMIDLGVKLGYIVINQQ